MKFGILKSKIEVLSKKGVNAFNICWKLTNMRFKPTFPSAIDVQNTIARLPTFFFTFPSTLFLIPNFKYKVEHRKHIHMCVKVKINGYLKCTK